jgi:hypothetical protein
MDCYKAKTRALSKLTVASANAKIDAKITLAKTASLKSKSKAALSKTALSKPELSKTALSKPESKTALSKPESKAALSKKKEIDDSDSDTNVVSIGTPEYDISITPYNTPSPPKQDKTSNSPCFEMQVSSNTPFTLKVYYRN